MMYLILITYWKWWGIYQITYLYDNQKKYFTDPYQYVLVKI